MSADQDDVPYIVMNVRNTRDYDSNVTINLKDTDLVRLDMASRAAYEAQNDVYPDDYVIEEKRGQPNESTKVNTDSNGVVTSITFNMPKETSEDIKFYKVSPTNEQIASTYEEWQNIFSIEREKNN